MFLIAVAFLFGHCVVHQLPQLPPLRPWFVVIPALMLGAAWMLRRCQRRLIVHVALAFLLGFAQVWLHATYRMSDRWPEARSGTDVTLQGTVVSIVERREDHIRFRLRAESDDADVPQNIELSWYDTQMTPRPGERWSLRARLRSPHGFANPGGYDYESQLLRESVGATGYVRDSSDNIRIAPASGHWILRARARIADRLARELPGSPMLGIVQGLTVGETSRMSNEQWRVFASTGTTHLMAISGMHIGMVALLISWMAGQFARRFRLQSTRFTVVGIQAIAGIGAAAGYSALAGFSVPTQRTFVMLAVFLCARLLRREVTASRSFALALIGVLVVDPFAPLAAGFWLSFGAVGAIFLATSGAVFSDSRAREYGRLQLVATVGLTPLVMSAFGRVSLLSPFVNLAAIPFFTVLIVPCVLIATALLAVSDWLGGLVLHSAVWLLERSWIALDWASRLPLAMWSFPDVPLWAFALLVLGVFVFLAPGVFATRMAGIILCLPALLWQPSRPRHGELDVAMLDVGQGLSLVVTTATHVLVYDTGPSFRSGRDAGELVVIPYLHAHGIRSIDMVMISHGDTDHAGGLDSVVRAIPTAALMLGPSVAPRAGSDLCAAGRTWRWDGVDFEILYPHGELQSMRRNDSSCVLRITGAGGSVILLGDVERAAEHWLLERGALTRADLAVVPHHGSRTSSTQGLVMALSPRYALVSAGFGNQWGFPKDDVLARWRQAGAVPLQTAPSGAIEITIKRNGVEKPREYRIENRRYWRK